MSRVNLITKDVPEVFTDMTVHIGYFRFQSTIYRLFNYEDRYKLKDRRCLESAEENLEATEGSANESSVDSYMVRDRYHNMKR